MPHAPRKHYPYPLPDSLGKIDLPTPSKLELAHAEKLRDIEGGNFFSPTAKYFLRSLSAHPSFNSLYLSLKFNRAFDFKYWFVFDQGYRLRDHTKAMDMSEEQLRTFALVVRGFRCMSGISAMIMVATEEDLEVLMERSPIFGWLSMIAGGQSPEERWIYFLRPEGGHN
jgi:hypothetical protein